MLNEKSFTLVKLINGIGLIVGIATLIGIGYITIHFITIFW